MLKKVVFLDRDGVINKDSPDYIKSWPEFIFLPKSIAAITHLTLNGFTIIIISNQSAVSRKIISVESLEYIHAMMKKAVMSRGGDIKDIFYCPHLPEDGCDCRKPKPGLIYKAQKKYKIDLADSVMVGDRAKDIECAKNAGCGGSVLVLTGNRSSTERNILKKKNILPDYSATDLYETVDWIINSFKKTYSSL